MELLKHEINKLIHENPDLLKKSSLKDMSPARREQRWFDMVNHLSSRLVVHFSDHLLTRLSGANVFNIFQTIGSAGGLYTLLAPYFIAYSQFNIGRDLSSKLSDCFVANSGDDGSEGNPSHSIHVAHFTDTFYEVNGVALTLRQQVKLASRNQKKYTLVTCDSSEKADLEGVKHFKPIGTFELPEYPELKLYYPPFLDILDYCHESGFTQIHTATPGPIGLTALAVAKILKLPISGTYHTQIPQYAQVLTGSDFIEEMAWKFTLWYYDQLDVIYHPSESTRQELVQKGITPSKIKLYPRGIDIDQFQPTRRNGFFKKYIEADQYIKFLYVGRISLEKNIDLLVKAFKKLTAMTGKKVFLCVVGDGPYMDRMKSEMQDLPCLFTGYLKGDKLAQAYASSDLFVFPSTTDTFGNVVLEAQASGLPVIVTDQGGPRENIIPGETGQLVKGGSEQELLDAMLEMTKDPERIRRMGKQARVYTEGRSFETAFMQTWNLFNEVEHAGEAVFQ